LSLEEKKEILEWREHSEIKKWMVDQSLNLYNEIIKLDDMGVITVKKFENYIILGLFKNLEKNSVGSKIMEFALWYVFKVLRKKEIVVYVMEKNKRAIHLYEKFGFCKIGRYKNVIKMRKYDTVFNQ
jgi:UDP-4-amino-4,6-dideoxy-N-acetyl-beta-L-altrosamine N-acetyltransferase